MALLIIIRSLFDLSCHCQLIGLLSMRSCERYILATLKYSICCNIMLSSISRVKEKEHIRFCLLWTNRWDKDIEFVFCVTNILGLDSFSDRIVCSFTSHFKPHVSLDNLENRKTIIQNHKANITNRYYATRGFQMWLWTLLKCNPQNPPFCMFVVVLCTINFNGSWDTVSVFTMITFIDSYQMNPMCLHFR